MKSFFAKVKIFRFWGENHGLIFASPKKFGEKYAVLKRMKREI